MEDKTLTYMGIFKVKKLGKKGYSQKERILLLNEFGVSYYVMPPEHNNYNSFITLFKNYYSNYKKLHGNIKVENENEFIQICREFDKIKFTLDIRYLKDTIPFDSLETSADVDSNPKGFKIPIFIRQRMNASSNQKEINLIKKKGVNNNDDKTLKLTEK